MDAKRADAKRIIMVSDSFPPVPSGVSKYSYQLTIKLIESGHKVFVVTGGVKVLPKEDWEISKIGGRVLRFGKLVSVNANGTRCFITLLSPADILKITGFFRAFSPDTVIMQGPLGLTLPYPATVLARSLKAKTVGIFHSSTDKPNLGYILFGRFMRPFLKAVDVKIAVSHRAREEVEKYFGKQDFKIVPPGVDRSTYNPAKGRKPADKLVFFFLGRLDERKGVDVLLNAWRRAPKFGLKNGKTVPSELLIGGDGPMRSLVQRSSNLENLKYLGFVEEEKLPHLYASADVSVFPSKGGESFGIVLIESMASGTPVVASRIGGYKDVVEEGRVGLLFSSEDELVEKMRILSFNEKLRNALSSNCVSYTEKYDWNTISQEIQDLL